MFTKSVHLLVARSSRAVSHLLALFIVLSLLVGGCDAEAPASPSPVPPTATAGAGSTASNAGTPAPTAGTATLVPGSSPQVSQANPGGASPIALAYLTYAVDYVQKHALNSDKVDWRAVRADVFGPDLKAQTTADTYPAIGYVLEQLQVNHHSFLLTPDQARQWDEALAASIGLKASYSERKVVKVQPGSMAEKAGVRAGDAIIAVNDTPTETLGAVKFFAQLYFGSSVKLELRRGDSQSALSILAQIDQDPVDPTSIVLGRRLAGNIGYIALPAVGASPVLTYYADITQQIIRDIDQTPTCGWVVDLQGNAGGNAPSMQAGIGPVLGEGLIGSFSGPGGSDPLSYRSGQLFVGETLVWKVDPPYHLQRENPPVAVLTDGQTASAAEAVLIAFRGRPGARSFGEPTWGVPTANVLVPLSDGATLVLTVAKDVDRTGQAYDGKIPPDMPVPANTFWRGTDKDSVLQAAVTWLKQQPACASEK